MSFFLLLELPGEGAREGDTPGEELLKQCRAQHGGTQTCVLIDGPLHAANVGCIMRQAGVSGMFMSFPVFRHFSHVGRKWCSPHAGQNHICSILQPSVMLGESELLLQLRQGSRAAISWQ